MAAEPVAERKLAAILHADVVGYSRLMAADEDATVRSLRASRGEIEQLVAQHGGRLVDTAGDSVLAEFPTATDAVECAVEIQGGAQVRNAALSREQRMEFRIGIHLGEIRVEEGRIYGDGVNIAARLEALAEAGGICLSATVHDQIRGRLDLACEDLGEQSLKNIPSPVRAFAVRSGSREERETDRTPARAGDRPSIAVLPFMNIGGDEEHEYLADGMTEDVITLLSRTPGLFVVARNSTFAYKGKSPDIRTVGRELGVRYVLEGSLRKLGRRARVTVQLIEAETGSHVWADRYDRPLDEIFDLQDEVTETIAAQLQPHVVKAEATRAKRHPPESLDAWALYLRAVDIYFLRGARSSSSERSQDLLEHAIKLDPDYPYAHAFLASMMATRVSLTASSDEDHDRATALRENRLALQLAPSDPLVLYHSGVVAALLESAERGLPALEQAVELDPNDPQATAFLGMTLIRSGRAREGMTRVEHALRVSPRDPRQVYWYGFLALGSLALGDWEEVLAYAQESQGRAAGSRGLDSPAAAFIVAANMALGRAGEAKASLEQMRARFPHATLDWVRTLWEERFFRLPDPATNRRFTELLESVGLT
jgi:adenylate cyclase